MPQPWKHPKTGVYWFRKTVPAPLRPVVGKREIKFSLKTKDPREAKLRYPEAAARADAVLQQARGGPIHLTQREVFGLAGEWLRQELRKREDDPGDPVVLEEYLWHLKDLWDESLTDEYRRFPEPVDAPEFKNKDFLKEVKEDVDTLLASQGLLVDDDTRERLCMAAFDKKGLLYATLLRRAHGDYGAVNEVENLPPWQHPGTLPKKPTGLTLQSLVDFWANERDRQPKTVYEWQRKVGRLREHLGHDDPERVTKADIIAWKDSLFRAGKQPKTVKNHVDVIRVLYKSALDNERLQRKDNPAQGVKVDAKQDPKQRRLPYSDQDAVRILNAARQEAGGARRWVPWLLAFTGARLDEVCQALTTDIQKDTVTGIWFLDINAGEGKNVKNIGSVRKVPLHRVLIHEGFLKYVRSLPEGGPLFPDLHPDRFGSRGGNATKILGRWTRKLGVTDKRKAPNHSWRHRFKDVCRDVDIEKPVRDAVMGHTSGDVADQYGQGYSLRTLAREIEKIPVPKGLARETDQGEEATQAA